MRNEYARPDFMRKRVISLCGKWQFEIADENPQPLSHYLSEPLPLSIEVPFTPDCELSEINTPRPLRSIWYKRTISIAEKDLGGAVLLNFGAVDYRTDVYINDTLVMTHTGGYTPFSCDISPYLNAGENVITVNATDGDNDETIIYGGQKSIFNPNGYAPVTGIWQPVWIEFTAKTYFLDCRITAVPKKAAFIIEGNIVGDITGKLVEINISFKKKPLVSYRYKATRHYFLSAPVKSQPIYWNLYEGNIYDVVIKIIDSDNVTELDYVKTYGAFRTVELASRMLTINGKEVTIRAVADRGIFPKGRYTAPSFEAFKQEISLAMIMGFNAILTKGKIPEPLYLYVADLLGMMIIEEYPTGHNPLTSAEAPTALINEWDGVLKRDYGHPSIVIWAPSSAYFGVNSNLAFSLYEMTRARDLTRPVIDTTGGVHYRTDIFTKALAGLSEEEFERLMTLPYNGRPLTEREIKKHIAPYPESLGAMTFFNLPCLVSAMGEYHIKSKMGYLEERELIEKLDRLIRRVESVGAMGYVFNYLADVEDDFGLVDVTRGYKFSREAIPLLQKMNKMSLPSSKKPQAK